MGKEERFTTEESHRRFAADLFNHTWDLLEKEDRTAEEDERMVHAAHASRFHWGEIGDPLNLAVGEWQIARVHATLHQPRAALRHAKRSLELIKETRFLVSIAPRPTRDRHALTARRETLRKPGVT